MERCVGKTPLMEIFHKKRKFIAYTVTSKTVHSKAKKYVQSIPAMRSVGGRTTVFPFKIIRIEGEMKHLMVNFD
jgi:hypothetical protein